MNAVYLIDDMLNQQQLFQDETWYNYLGCAAIEEMSFFAANIAFDPIPYWRQVSCPVLAIWGEADLYVPTQKSKERLTQALTQTGNLQVSTYIFPQANHGIGIIKTGRSDEKWGGFVPGYLELMVRWLEKLYGSS